MLIMSLYSDSVGPVSDTILLHAVRSSRSVMSARIGRSMGRTGDSAGFERERLWLLLVEEAEVMMLCGLIGLAGSSWCEAVDRIARRAFRCGGSAGCTHHGRKQFALHPGDRGESTLNPVDYIGSAS